MSVKIILLKSGETIISDAKELVSDNKVCGYLFKEPHKIEINRNNTVLLLEESETEVNPSVQISLSPWIFLSKDTEIPIPPDWIVTIVEPIDSVKEMYEEKVNGKECKMPSVEN